jgi:hypothetical protein
VLATSSTSPPSCRTSRRWPFGSSAHRPCSAPMRELRERGAGGVGSVSVEVDARIGRGPAPIPPPIPAGSRLRPSVAALTSPVFDSIGHEEKNSQRVYIVCSSSVSGTDAEASFQNLSAGQCADLAETLSPGMTPMTRITLACLPLRGLTLRCPPSAPALLGGLLQAPQAFLGAGARSARLPCGTGSSAQMRWARPVDGGLANFRRAPGFNRCGPSWCVASW